MSSYSPYSDLKIFRHIDAISGMLEGKRIAPIYLRIKPTNVCNQRCFFCAYANDNLFDDRAVENRESIPWEILERTLIDFAAMGGKAVTYSGGGEPLCYHSIIETLKLTEKLGLDCSMITNAQALVGEPVEYLRHAKWIRVSFDASNGDIYKGIRNVNSFERVTQNIANFAKIKDDDCVLGINCVISKSNAEDIYEISKLAKELGVNNIKFSPVLVKSEEEAYHSEIKDSVNAQIARAKAELEEASFRIVDKYTNDYALSESYVKPYHRCYIQEYFAVIAADAKVYRCHQRAYTKAGEVGDLKKQSFKEIWYNPEVVEQIRKFDPCEQCDFRCAFDERNSLLNNYFMMDTNHVNFV
ncbi:MAG: radical SAM protein [Lachnospiraceae bacterium]|nr:radical SAM protein [Lachnospiraceae bacterium]